MIWTIYGDDYCCGFDRADHGHASLYHDPCWKIASLSLYGDCYGVTSFFYALLTLAILIQSSRLSLLIFKKVALSFILVSQCKTQEKILDSLENRNLDSKENLTFWSTLKSIYKASRTFYQKSTRNRI